MPQEPMTRERAIRELQSIARGEDEAHDPNLARFSTCQELQQASAVLGRAARAFHARGHSAFTAATHTPITAPPGWLPPPI